MTGLNEGNSTPHKVCIMMCLPVAPDTPHPTMRQPHLITISDRPLHHLWHKLLQQPAAMSSLINIDYLHLFSRVHANPCYIAGPAPYQSALWSPASYTQSVARERKKETTCERKSFPGERGKSDELHDNELCYTVLSLCLRAASS